MKIFLYLQFAIFGLIIFVPTLAKPDILLAQSSRPQETNSEINTPQTLLKRADRMLAKLPENLPLSIPLCRNSPVNYPISSDDSCIGKELIAVAYISSTGVVSPITPRNLRPMFAAGMRNSGRLSSFKENIKLSSRIPVVDLVVEDKMGLRKILYEVSANSFMRACLNAVLSGDLHRFN